MFTKFLLVLFCVTLLWGEQAQKLHEKYEDSSKCKKCHMPIVHEWQDSWHAKSHYRNDEYLRASIKYVARKSRLSTNIVRAQCAKCHNPRISVKVTEGDVIGQAVGIHTAIEGAVKDKTLQEGINCLVCHNIDKIHTKAPISVRGMDRVEWTPNGVMSGPYKDANSPYHKTLYRDFFDKNPNKLCFVCHANDTSYANKKLFISNMEKEYKGKQKCTECHMGPKKKGYAATIPLKNGKKRSRMVRAHHFKGAHSESMWKKALTLSLRSDKKNVWITIKNPQPHNIPSGFGGRELLVEVEFYKGTKKIDTKLISLTTYYKRKRLKASTPHMALQKSKELSVPAKGKKRLKIPKNKEATSMKVTLYYRLVNSEIRKLLRLQDAIWKKKFYITSKSLQLKKH